MNKGANTFNLKKHGWRKTISNFLSKYMFFEQLFSFAESCINFSLSLVNELECSSISETFHFTFSFTLCLQFTVL